MNAWFELTTTLISDWLVVLMESFLFGIQWMQAKVTSCIHWIRHQVIPRTIQALDAIGAFVIGVMATLLF